MKLAYFDCFSGISGDMTLGALVDAGVSLDHLREQLRGLGVTLHEGYDAAQLDRYPADLYVVGNAMTRGRPVIEGSGCPEGS